MRFVVEALSPLNPRCGACFPGLRFSCRRPALICMLRDSAKEPARQRRVACALRKALKPGGSWAAEGVSFAARKIELLGGVRLGIGC